MLCLWPKKRPQRPHPAAPQAGRGLSAGGTKRAAIGCPGLPHTADDDFQARIPHLQRDADAGGLALTMAHGSTAGVWKIVLECLKK